MPGNHGRQLLTIRTGAKNSRVVQRFPQRVDPASSDASFRSNGNNIAPSAPQASRLVACSNLKGTIGMQHTICMYFPCPTYRLFWRDSTELRGNLHCKQRCLGTGMRWVTQENRRTGLP